MTSLARRSTRASAYNFPATYPNLSNTHYTSRLQWDNRKPISHLVYRDNNTIAYLELVGRVSRRNFFMDTFGEERDDDEPLATTIASCVLERPTSIHHSVLWDTALSSLSTLIGLIPGDSSLHGVFDASGVKFGQPLYRRRVRLAH